MFMQLDTPQNNYTVRDMSWYGLRWLFSFSLMELMTHLFRYNAFAIRLEFKYAHHARIFQHPV